MATTHSQSTSQPPSSSISLPDGLSADAVDTVPVLSAVLSRLQNISTTTSGAGSPPTPSPSQAASGTGPLTIKDIPTATDGLKHKLQRARAQVKELPDIERSAAEQEHEIRELEVRIARQRDVLETLRRAGIAARRDREAGADAMQT